MQSQNEAKQILVVDDDATVRELLKDIAERQGFTVDVAVDGETAIAAIKKNTYGLALVDKNLPGQANGLDVLRAIRDNNDLTRVIIITAYASKSSAIEALRSGAFDYIEKPFELELLLEKISRAWTGYHRAVERSDLFARYEILFEIVPGIVWFMAQNGVLTRINTEGAQMLGYAQKDLLGMSYKVLLDPNDKKDASHWAFRERRMGSRGTRRQVVELKTSAGETRLFEMSSTGAYDRAEDDPLRRHWGTLGVGWDITEHAKLQAQLQQARKMEALGRLAGGVAHDFNNLLSVIINNAIFVRNKLTPGDQCHTDVLDIEQAGMRAAELTRQLLSMSRQQMVASDILNVSEVVRGLESMLRRLVSENIVMKMELSEDLFPIKINKGQLEQVIVNLIANAADAMGTGGVLTIATKDIDVDQEMADSTVGLCAGPYVVMSVRDTGAGMSSEVQQHIFEPFYTTKEQGKGTGLGMATVYGIVNQCGGCLEVQSVESEGTTMRVYLPRTHEATNEASTSVTSKEVAGHENILIVEDEAMVRRLAERILKSHGYGVLTAEHGTHALEICAASKQPIDVLLTDIVMPQMSGTRLSYLMREKYPKAKVVYMSGYVGQKGLDTEVLHKKGSTFLQKPFTHSALLAAIRLVLDGSSDSVQDV